MTSTRAEITISRPVDQVWAVVADGAAIATWMPGVESCDVTGDIRVAVLAGRRLTEKISVDHTQRRFTYEILDRGAPPPIEAHQGSLQVYPTDGGALVVYAHDVKPDELAERFQAASVRALRGLKDYCEEDR
jgi:carbon monoxide dehydrogenase subunit G